MRLLLRKAKIYTLLILAISFIGCEDDDEVVLPEVIAGFTFTLNQQSGTVTFINISEEAQSFLWNFGDGDTSTEINPVKMYESGSYTVTLTASNAAGASATFEDNLTVTIPTPGPGFDSGLLTNGDFENGVDPWIGNGANIDTDGGNSFNFVNVETAGNAFDVNLSQVVEITQGTNYILTFDASSDRERTMLAGIGLNEAPFTNTAPSVDLTTTTQTFILQLSAADFGGANSRVLFDMGADVGVVVIDNVSLVEGGDGSDSNTGGGFDSGLIANGDFEAGDTSWIGSGLNIVTDGGNSFNSVDVTVAGNAFDVNLSQVVEITQGTNYILTFDASSDRMRTMLAGIGLNEDPFTNTAPSVDLTTDTQTFMLQLAATDFGSANSRILFDMGAEVGTVVIDNVSLVEGGDGSDSNTGGGGTFDSGLLTNGDFENGSDSWTVGVGSDPAPVATDAGNTFYSVDVMTAGAAFDVNLTQMLEIVQGSTYTLTFDAWSDRDRSIVAGIGLSDGDFSNTSETVNITATRDTYMLSLTATTFGAANARVLFDSGAEVGLVNIDNVSLVLDSSGGGGGGCTATEVAATALPLDFEGCETFLASQNFGSGLTSQLVANPFKTGINTSDFVLQVDKPSGSEFFAGIQNTFASNFDLTTTNTFKAKIYSTKANVTFRFELAVIPNDGSLGNPNPVFVTIANANEWTEVEFTFINLPEPPTTYNHLVIKPDNDAMDSPITEDGTYYIDDIVLE
ncbi:carbohydrate binding domain-containing protein [Poritiphilus flavus]|uniref:PKD domain-containing protein n=1 Tax=Poritiphilus flavus TaxID=2697053 RepID=A0A6L9E9P8_9FLAO|nr:carbohydrate binding domain-containing protein [Poritiphilus flavus]NAS11475.1 PKD domain-containing protein [Poritiphilus flavus]